MDFVKKYSFILRNSEGRICIEENYFRNYEELLVSREREQMKVISQKKFSIKSDPEETSNHATPTIIIEIKTLDLFQAT